LEKKISDIFVEHFSEKISQNSFSSNLSQKKFWFLIFLKNSPKLEDGKMMVKVAKKKAQIYYNL